LPKTAFKPGAPGVHESKLESLEKPAENSQLPTQLKLPRSIWPAKWKHKHDNSVSRNDVFKNLKLVF